VDWDWDEAVVVLWDEVDEVDCDWDEVVVLWDEVDCDWDEVVVVVCDKDEEVVVVECVWDEVVGGYPARAGTAARMANRIVPTRILLMVCSSV
jgi:hypothetical protein